MPLLLPPLVCVIAMTAPRTPSRQTEAAVRHPIEVCTCHTSRFPSSGPHSVTFASKKANFPPSYSTLEMKHRIHPLIRVADFLRLWSTTYLAVVSFQNAQGWR
ncbi:hypothetical protein EDB89DRAFT_1323393 [Lactarius sanguifluus]|nr:hypothetical protein EDB89DRAFT_1323393 [Lactarius sanguifluus]